ncbi:retrotransposon protein, putative, ty1-copia subclass [Tanacetum coccineum]
MTRNAPNRMCLYIDAKEHELGDLSDPANYKAALLDPESDKWLDAMNWLFKKKTDMDGVVYTYKARLVAKGYTQTPRIDYEETFSPIVDIRVIRILKAIAMYYDYEIWQIDVKTAFLNGYLSKEQASRKWNKRFDDEVKKFGFTQNHDEPCVYLKASGTNVTFLILCFAMKDLGEAAYILGIKIYRDRSRRLIKKLRLSKSQGDSTPAELKRMHNVPYASAVGSIMYGVRCTRPDVAFAHAFLNGYLSNKWSTLSNLKVLVKSISKNQVGKLKRSIYGLKQASSEMEYKRFDDEEKKFGFHSKYDEHVNNIPNIIRCKITTLKVRKFNEISNGEFKWKDDPLCLTDADDLKSQTGYVFILNGGVIDWKSTKQSIFATSFAEAEYIATYDASKEAVWVRKFIYGLGVVPIIKEPINMYCANTGAITIANESGITKCARHFRVKVHNFCEVIEYCDIKLEKVHIYDNLADPFTKELAFPNHSEHTKNIGMLSASSPM